MFQYKIFLLLALALFAFADPAFAQSSAREPFEGAYTSGEFAGGAVRDVYCALVNEVESSFGALVMIAAGLMAFAFATFGDGRRAYTTVAVGIVGATISTGISLYFGDLCRNLGGQQSRAAVNRTISDVGAHAADLGAVDADFEIADDAIFNQL